MKSRLAFTSSSSIDRDETAAQGSTRNTASITTALLDLMKKV
jgi:hypothetical protein